MSDENQAIGSLSNVSPVLGRFGRVPTLAAFSRLHTRSVAQRIAAASSQLFDFGICHFIAYEMLRREEEMRAEGDVYLRHLLDTL